MAEILSKAFEMLGKKLVSSYLASGWQIDRLEKSRLTSFWGQSILRKASNKSILPLDLESRQHFSPDFQEKVQS